MKGRLWGAVLGFLLVVAALWGAVHALREAVYDPILGAGPVELVIEPGMTANTVATRLEAAGVVSSARVLVGWLWWTERTGGIDAGEYRFSQSRSVAEIADIITEGRVLLHSVTIPEGATRWQVAEAIADAGFGGLEDALAATTLTHLVTDLDPRATSLEGYLYPETYMAPSSAGAVQLVEAMVARFRALWTPQRQRRAEELELSLRDVVILASLIEAETPAGEERPVVSAVFHNRLARGMLLQTDPTLIYAKRLTGNADRTIRRSDLARDSPYNTYLYSGLPAGPVGNPRAASIDAALQPAESDYLYFVSRNDGTHVFSRTLSEHNRVVNVYQRSP